MHVGHLRSTVIGDALARMLPLRRAPGDRAQPRRRLGHALRDADRAPARPGRGRGDGRRSPSATSTASTARRARSSTPTRPSASAAAPRVVALQAGDPETRRLWRVLVDESVAYFAERLRARSTSTLTPDDVVGESFYNDMLDDVVRDLDARGAPGRERRRAVRLPRRASRTATASRCRSSCRRATRASATPRRDLAAVRDRVGAPARRRDCSTSWARPRPSTSRWSSPSRAWPGGCPTAVRCEHVAFGNVLGPDRKMFKTRSGRDRQARRPARRGDRARRRRARRARERPRRPTSAPRSPTQIARARDQVRRPVDRAPARLRLRPGPHDRLRGRHRSLPAVRARAAALDLPPPRRAVATPGASVRARRPRRSATWRSGSSRFPEAFEARARVARSRTGCASTSSTSPSASPPSTRPARCCARRGRDARRAPRAVRPDGAHAGARALAPRDRRARADVASSPDVASRTRRRPIDGGQ